MFEYIRNADEIWVAHWQISRDLKMDSFSCGKALGKLRRRGILVSRYLENGLPWQKEWSLKRTQPKEHNG